MKDWKIVRAEVPALRFDLGVYYQGKYRREHFDPSEPETLRHAHELRYALENLPLSLHPEQEFLGGIETSCAAELPQGISAKEFDELCDFYGRNCPRRYFRTGHDHTTIDYRTIIENGLAWYIRRAEEGVRIHGNPVSESMLIVLRAVSAYFLRAADFFAENRPEVSARLRKLATDAPETFDEGLQLVWLLFCILRMDGRRYACALARIDQYLYGLYRKSALPREEALNLICHVWTKINEMHEVTNICIGGVTPDGEDAWNELSLLALEATDLVHSPHTNLSARLGPLTKDSDILACIRLIGTGIGFPAVFNDSVNIPMLCRLGIPLEAARDYALFGCVEPLIPGREVAWSDGRFSMPECFLKVVLRLPEFSGIEEVIAAYAAEMRAGMKQYADKFNADLLAQPADRYPDPLLSAFTSDCIGRGRDINDGGAEFPRLHGVGMMGLATITDGIAALKKLVFDEKVIAPERLVEALKNDFKGEEPLRRQLLHDAPKYGNDIGTDCDDIAKRMVDLCAEVCSEFRTADGGYFLSCMASNTSNVPAGAVLGATPDGRHAGEPLSDAASPCGGRDRKGPTAFVNSIITPDYTGQACTVVNMRFQPMLFNSEAGNLAMLGLLKRFVEGGGQEMQFNVTGTEKLEDAMAHPEKYEDLIVRVSGFSAYFNWLPEDVKKDILRRTAHLAG